MIPAKSRQKRFYGWTALAGAMLVSVGMVGNAVTSYGVFLPTISEELGWSRSTLSGPYTAFWIVLGLLGPLVGISIGKFGPRKNIIFGNLATVLGLLAMSRITEVWHAYLYFGILAGAGQAFGCFIATTTIANNWFIKRRSVAMGLVIAAGGIGGLALPPIISWLISSVGWRWGWVCLASIHLVLAVVLAGILIKNRPEELGQVPDGEAAGSPQEGDSGNLVTKVYQTAVDWKVGEALRTPALWLVVAFSAAHIFSLNFLAAHQVAYVQDLGFSLMTAATTLGLLSGMSIIGQLMCGTLAIRFEGRYLAVVCFVGFAVGMTILMNVRSLPFIYLHTVLSGISYGGLLVLMPVLIGAYFGRGHYPQIMGWTAPIPTLFGAGGPLLAGFIYDSTGSYRQAFVVMLVFLGVGMVCALLARPPIVPAKSQPAKGNI
ncbi:MAG: MFS transporter [Chloroflexota bacterium]